MRNILRKLKKAKFNSKMMYIKLRVFSFIVILIYLNCSSDKEQKQAIIEMDNPIGQIIFEDNFDSLENWHAEGVIEGVTLLRAGTLRLNCNDSKQGGIGCMAFCKQDFPGSICIEFDFYMEEKNGLVIVFCGMKGLNGEDAITGVPLRKGMFDEYTGKDAVIRSYHVSISRYDDNGIHTGISNWRRNPGLHLMAQGEDFCKEIHKTYHIKIIKAGPTCRLEVDGKMASEFTDPQTLQDEIPTTGKVGFRAIGKKAIARISNFRAKTLK